MQSVTVKIKFIYLVLEIQRVKLKLTFPLQKHLTDSSSRVEPSVVVIAAQTISPSRASGIPNTFKVNKTFLITKTVED